MFCEKEKEVVIFQAAAPSSRVSSVWSLCWTNKEHTVPHPPPPRSCFLSGPAAITDLSVKANSTNSLSFHWSPPEGDFERYELFLYRSDDSLQERRRGQSSSQQCSFQGLTPGAPYRMVVVTHSGEQSNQSSVWARTGEGRGGAHLPTHVQVLTSQFVTSCVSQVWRNNPHDVIVMSFFITFKVKSSVGHITSTVWTCRFVKIQNLPLVFSPSSCGVSEGLRWKPVWCSVGELGSECWRSEWLLADSLQSQRLSAGQDAAGIGGHRVRLLRPGPRSTVPGRGAESERRAEQWSQHTGQDWWEDCCHIIPYYYS